MENKEQFVKELGEVIANHCNIAVAKMEYVRPGKTYNEEVVITYKNGYDETVNVNMDSCLGILHDVAKHL